MVADDKLHKRHCPPSEGKFPACVGPKRNLYFTWVQWRVRPEFETEKFMSTRSLLVTSLLFCFRPDQLDVRQVPQERCGYPRHDHRGRGTDQHLEPPNP